MKTIETFIWRAVLLAGLLSFAFPINGAHATVIFDTLGPGNSYRPNDSIGFGKLGSTSYGQALQFTATTDYILNSIDFALKTDSGSNVVDVRILQDKNGVPDSAAILEATSIAAPLESGIITADFAGTTIVTHNSTYWVWLTSSGVNLWHRNNMDYYGVYYTSFTEDGPPWLYEAWTYPAFRVEGTSVAVSEPAIFTLLAAALLLLVTFSARRKRPLITTGCSYSA